MKTLEDLRRAGFDVKSTSHAEAVLNTDFPGAISELAGVLLPLRLPVSEIIGSGGGETKFTQRTRRSLTMMAWKKHIFQVDKVVDKVRRESTSHEVDHVRRYEDTGVIGCEIEWNNKDPFFDRDLENFKRLHAEGAISVGVVITRGATLQDSMYDTVRKFADTRGIKDFSTLAKAGVKPTLRQRENIAAKVDRMKGPIAFADAWADNFVSNKFGVATTHWAKLMDRVSRGVGNPCPLLLIGLPASMVVFDTAKVEVLDEDPEAPDAPVPPP